MQTNFTLAQLADPNIAEADKILRACVHCGFCTATCPTYVLLGDELDSPRGRIYLIKEMLEHDRPADAEVVTHIDRCLSCLACMTTCPSGVHYMHLVDHARAHIEETYRRPLPERMVRALLAWLMPYPARFRRMLSFAPLGKPFAPLLDALGFNRIAAMLRLAPWRLPAAETRNPGVYPAQGRRKGRVALLSGCVDPVVRPSIRAAAIRLLNRHGIEVVLARGEACCGSLVHHMGRERDALRFVKNNVDAWMREIEGDGLDAILVTASGCGTTIKDYGFMLRTDAAYAKKAEKVSALAKDISEYLMRLEMPAAPARGISVAYHSACSMQHGQQDRARAEGIAGARRLRGARRARRASVLRLGRHLQPAAAGNRDAAARPQGREHRKDRPGSGGHGQYRLPGADRAGHQNPRCPHGGAPGLGERRAHARTFAQQRVERGFRGSQLMP